MAARVGAIEAELADLKLRLTESHEREQRLIQVSKELEETLEGAPKREHELRRDLERLAAFNRGVEQSRAWKLIQRVRRLFGREW